jgi:lipopolysaccharide/colanic/teichoic acid biosynthesis glycosyltransferase
MEVSNVVRASVRGQVRYAAVSRRELPERLDRVWTLALIFVDALAALACAFVVGLPNSAGPAACVVVCGGLAAVRIYQTSYAMRWYDETYHVITGCAVAAVPLWLVLHAIGAFSTATVFATLVLCAIVISALHALLYRARHPERSMPDGGLPAISPEAQWRVGRSLYRPFKRACDLVMACAGIAILSPLMLLVAVCIAIESGFPILFRQERIGRGGTRFTILKFRTMFVQSDSKWALPGDARITPLGEILRRVSLDELPQLFNVVRGDMSLVGPRPEMGEFAARFLKTIPHYDERHTALPGLTGWAQVQLKRNLQPGDMDAVVPYDLFYVENASPILDAIIVIKTAAEFLFHRAV